MLKNSFPVPCRGQILDGQVVKSPYANGESSIQKIEVYAFDTTFGNVYGWIPHDDGFKEFVKLSSGDSVWTRATCNMFFPDNKSVSKDGSFDYYGVKGVGPLM